MPLFSVVMATYNRGRHILPSVQSVLRQSFPDFELLVVGDHCTDDTAAVLQPELGSKVRWINLAERWGSQSGPNNEGIRQASGRYIAYLGHDDIWTPGHLAELLKLFEADPQLAFAVGGAIFHAPAGCDYREITGVFTEPDAARKHFFPPSSFAHRRDVVDRIGFWRRPLEIVPPVDMDFLLRAANAGMRFGSTQTISVHKFAAAHRYLSYLEPSSAEQADMLRRMAAPDYPEMVQAEVNRAKQLGTFMDIHHAPTEGVAPGKYARASAAMKGLVRPRVRPLIGRTAIEQDNWPRALDWRRAEAGQKIRWAYLNPNPKLLIPYSSEAAVRISLMLAHDDPEALKSIALRLNGETLAGSCAPAVTSGEIWSTVAVFTGRLNRQRHSIIELGLLGPQIPTADRRGIGVGEIVLEPLT